MMIVSAGLIFTGLDTSAKFLVISGVAPEFVSWVRFTGHMLVVLIFFRAWKNPRVLAFNSLPVQIVRGLLLFGSTFLNFKALASLQLAETMSIYFFQPMMITALAGPLLGEWAGWRRWLALGIGLVGVIMITRPGLGVFGIGHLYAICSMMCFVFYALITRKVGERETAESLIFYAALTPVILMAPALPATASWPPSALVWFLLVSLGVYGSFGHFLVIRAYQIASPSALAPYAYFQMVWMIVSGLVIFDQLPDGWTLAGCALIVASGLYIVHREHRLRIAERSLAAAEQVALAARADRKI